MKSKKNLYITFLFGLLILYSCDKEHDYRRVEFPINYTFYNQGDTSLKKVVLYCSTFYPEEKVTGWLSTGKWRDAYYYDSQYLLHDFDSIIAEPDLLVYSACIYEYNVALHFINTTGSGFVKLFTKTDTIYSNSSIDIKFVWPKDSLNYIRLD